MADILVVADDLTGANAARPGSPGPAGGP